jgi:gluconokinase
VNTLRAVVVMGVSGAGKTHIGSELARALGWHFEDGDDHHPASNRLKMASGTPLNDEDRWPWLEHLRTLIDAATRDSTPTDNHLVLACSALKASYRARLGEGNPHLAFIFLHGDPSLIEARLRARSGHYMPASLLGSQFATLEPPEEAWRVDIDAPPEVVVARALERLRHIDKARSTDAGGSPGSRRPSMEDA